MEPPQYQYFRSLRLQVCKPEYCELQRWREIIDLYQNGDPHDGRTNVQVLGLVETKNDDGTPRDIGKIENDIKLYKDHVPAISGFYLNEVGTPKNVAPYHANTDSHVTLAKVSLKNFSFK